jgi:hypothetical protein
LDVPVNVESSTTVVANVAEVESWTRYEVAPVEAFQVNVADTATPVAPLAGDERTGATGAPTIVVKLAAVEYELVPPAFFAFTRQ